MPEFEPVLEPLGDAAWLLRFGDRPEAGVNARVHGCAAWLRERLGRGFELVPAYASLAVHFDPSRCLPLDAREAIDRALRGWPGLGAVDGGADTRLVTIPCRYGGAEGPDLEDLARHAGLEPDEVVRRHVACTFQVAMLGFQPGFPYLLGLDPALEMPRLATPRAQVPAGSVAIGGAQCGIYPRTSPGGWRVLGRTPAVLFDASAAPPALLRPGDRVRFRPIEPGGVATAEVAIE